MWENETNRKKKKQKQERLREDGSNSKAENYRKIEK